MHPKLCGQQPAERGYLDVFRQLHSRRGLIVGEQSFHANDGIPQKGAFWGRGQP